MRRLAPLLAALALFALPASAQATSPWWQLLGGSRPTNLQVAPDQSEVQEVSTAKVDLDLLGESVIARIEVGGEAAGCLGTGEFFFQSATEVCEAETGFAATETSAALAELLEGLYETEVQVSGPANLGEGPFDLTTPGHWVAPLALTPLVLPSPFEPEDSFTLGSAEAKVISEGSGRLAITATNLGDAPLDATSTPLQITDDLPEGVQAYGVEAFAGAQGSAGPIDCAIETTPEETGRLDCSFEGVLPSYEAIEVELQVAIKAGGGAEAGQVTLSGANAPTQSISQPVNVSSAPVPFGIESFSALAEAEGGGAAEEAGTNPFQLTNTIQFNSGPVIGSSRREAVVVQPAIPRNTAVSLPAGLAGSARSVKPCDLATFLGGTSASDILNECPDSSAVGVASVTIIEHSLFGLLREAVPVFALPPQHGEPARFGFKAVGVPVLIDTSVDPEDEYRITGEVRNAPQTAQVLSATLSLWGVPGDPRHDSSRGWNCVYFLPEGPCEDPSNSERSPLLRLPASCRDPLAYRGKAEPWNTPLGSLVDRPLFTGPQLRACNQVPFDPEISNALTSRLASNPSGLDFGLDLPNQWPEEAKEGAKSEAQFKKVTVALPEGVTVNPSQAEGLATCSQADYARERYDSGPGEGCPEASKIGSVKISTPLLEEDVEGSLYVATPYENPTHTLIGLYLVAKIPDRGILVKQAGKVEPDPATGQLVSTFDDVPQVPFSSFKLHFREGGRAPLVTPPACGTYTTVAKFVPWSAQDPDNPEPGEVVERTAPFTIDRGVTGGACPSGPAPFHPGFEAGTLNNQAGSYSPFVMRLTRQDGEQDMGKFSFVLPPGVVPKLAGIPYCSDQAIAKAKGRTGPHGGTEELADPSCPAASQIGRTVAGAGVGNQLTYVPGKLYLAGPYHGDPISAVSITPAVAGPFDAGVVVVREALRLNPVTYVGEVDGAASDPIPHILKGIPLNLRDLHVYADKPEFTLNATSCEPFSASSTIWGDGTALEPRPESPVTLSSRYQAAGCASLGFAPKLGLKLKGGTKRGKFPALNATYTPRPGDANLSRLALTFPTSEFIEQGHFGTICTRVQFAAGAGNGSACPPASVYGQVTAYSPLLAEPLSGPVYLRSSSHNLPDAVFALHGLVDIDVVVRIDSSHGGLRATVEGAPDAPVSKAIVEMQGGKKGLFVNSTDLCAGTHKAKGNLIAQNGKAYDTRPVLRANCKRAHKRHRAHRGARAKTGGRR